MREKYLTPIIIFFIVIILSSLVSSQPYCQYSNEGNLIISDIDLHVDNGFGDDEIWYPLNNIEVEIELLNDGNEDINNIILTYGLYDSENSEIIFENQIGGFNLIEGLEKEINDEFQLDKNITKLENKSYDFYVKVIGEINGNYTCVNETYREQIDVIIEDDFVILDNLDKRVNIILGEEIQIPLEIWNIGKNNQSNVSIRIYEENLGIDQRINIGNITSMTKKEDSISIQIPSDISDEIKSSLYLFLYNSDDNIYENSFGEKSIFRILLRYEKEEETKEDGEPEGEEEESGEPSIQEQINQLQTEIDKLKKEIDELKEDNEDLEDRIEELEYQIEILERNIGKDETITVILESSEGTNGVIKLEKKIEEQNNLIQQIIDFLKELFGFEVE